MTTQLTQQQLQQVQTTLATGNVAETWQLLSSYGDNYATAAYQGISDPNSFYGQVIRNSWYAAGADLSKFNDVAIDHVTNYVNDIANAGDGSGSYTLPNTTQIEQSYYNAVTGNGLSPYAAIDFSLAVISGDRGGPDWYSSPWETMGTGVGLESSRIGPTAAAVVDLNLTQAIEQFSEVSLLTAGTSAALSNMWSAYSEGLTSVTHVGDMTFVSGDTVAAAFDSNGEGSAYIGDQWQSIDSSNWRYDTDADDYQYKGDDGEWHDTGIKDPDHNKPDDPADDVPQYPDEDPSANHPRPPAGLPKIPPLPRDPLVLDISGAGIELTGVSSSKAYFDFTGSGFATQTGWITQGEGLLVNVNGQNISKVSADNLLGAVSGDGFADLVALDTNSDGVIDINDPSFEDLRIWMDDNGDGSSTSGELYKLRDLGITAINVNASASNTTSNGNAIVSSATFIIDQGGTSTSHSIAEVNFSTQTEQSVYETPAGFSYAEETRTLPFLNGYGLLPNLRVAMSLNSTLLNDVRSLVLNASSLSSSDFNVAFDKIVEEWADVEDIDPASKGAGFDARHIAVVNTFYGIDPSVQTAYAGNVTSHSGPQYEAIYQSIVAAMKVRFAAQIKVSSFLNVSSDFVFNGSDPFWSLAQIQFDPVSGQISVDLDSLLSSLKQSAPVDVASANLYWDQALSIVGGLRVDLSDGSTNPFVAEFILSSEKVGLSSEVEAIMLSQFGFSRLDESGVTGTIPTLTSGKVVLLGTGDKSVSGMGEIYVYSEAGGNVSINPMGSSSLLAIAGVVADDVVFERIGGGNDLTIPNNATGKEVTLVNYFDGSPPAGILLGGNVMGLDQVNQALELEAVSYLISAEANGTTIDDEKNELSKYGFDATDLSGMNGISNGTDDSNVFFLGAGNQTAVGSWGNDIYVFGRGYGQDTINDSQPDGGDVLLFKSDTAPSDIVLSRSGLSLILSIAGTTDKVTIPGYFQESVTGTGTVDQIKFADGTVWDYDYVFAQVTTGTAGNDTLTGDGGANVLDGGAGNDTLVGVWGNDTYIFGRGYGQDTINDSQPDGGDVLLFKSDTAPSDIVLSRSGLNLILSIAGTTDKVTIPGYFQESVTGTGTVDQIKFADGTVWDYDYVFAQVTTGTAGNDTLTGDGGANVLDGGAGNDTLVGVWGNDTYIFGRGYGQDTINDSQPDGGDVLLFKSDTAPSDIVLSRSGLSLILSIAGTTDKVTIPGYFQESVTGTGTVDQIKFADGTVWDYDYVFAQVTTGTAGNDTLTGDGGANVLDGGAGNDTLVGVWGNDTYIFGRGYGQDTINDSQPDGGDVLLFKSDTAPSDITLSRSANDLVLSITGTTDKVTIPGYFQESVTGTGTVDQIKFTDGTVWNYAAIFSKLTLSGATSGNDVLIGDSNGNVLDGGAGNDTLNGSSGNDTYIFGRGYGQDTINDSQPDGGDVLLFKSDTAPSDIVLSRSGLSLILSIAGTTDKVTIPGYFQESVTGTGTVDQIKFADGTVWDYDYVFAQVTTGTAGNDTLTGDGGANVLDGGAGNDTLVGVWGNDTYIFGRGYGQDTINDSQPDGGDVLLFKSDTAPSDIVLSRSGLNLILSIAGTTDKVTIPGYFQERVTGTGTVDQIKFADGTVWDYDYVFAQVTTGTAGNDTLTGDGGANVLDGGAGNDTLVGVWGNDTYIFGRGYGQDTINDSQPDGGDVLLFKSDTAPSDIVLSRSGLSLILSIAGTTDKVTIPGYFQESVTGTGTVDQIKFADGTVWDYDYVFAQVTTGTAGNDTLTGDGGANVLDGGAGNDTLVGVWGNDTYIFGRGYGQDTINDSQPDGGDVLLFKSDTAPSDIVLSRSGLSLILSIAGTTDKVTIPGYFQESVTGTGTVDQIKFADGTVWDYDYVFAQVTTGTAGNDTLTGDGGANVLDGGAGNDTLVGVWGNDTYIFGRGYGQDTINDSQPDGGDVLLFKSDTAPSDIDLSRSGTNLVLSITGTTDTVTVIGYFGETGTGAVDQIKFTDGTVWNYAAIMQHFPKGTTGSDTLTGTASSDYLDGAAGADTLIGGTGNDTYVVDNVGDAIVENVGEGRDLVISSVSWMLSANTENLTLTGSSNINGSGNGFGNIIIGNGGSNILDGGAGADTLTGGLGNDTYVVDDIGDVVTENASSGIDLVQSSISSILGDNLENLTLTGSSNIDGGGNSLVNTINGNAGNNLLDGAGGADILSGGGGYDTYLFNVNYGNATIVNSVTGGTSASGELDFGSGITAQNLWFVHSGQDLIIDVLGTTDKVTVKGWFGTNASSQLSEIKTSDGMELDSNIGQLVSAMATFQASNSGFNPTTSGTQMPADTNVQNTIASAWHHA